MSLIKKILINAAFMLLLTPSLIYSSEKQSAAELLLQQDAQLNADQIEKTNQQKDALFSSLGELVLLPNATLAHHCILVIRKHSDNAAEYYSKLCESLFENLNFTFDPFIFTNDIVNTLLYTKCINQILPRLKRKTPKQLQKLLVHVLDSSPQPTHEENCSVQLDLVRSIGRKILINIKEQCLDQQFKKSFVQALQGTEGVDRIAIAEAVHFFSNQPSEIDEDTSPDVMMHLIMGLNDAGNLQRTSNE